MPNRATGEGGERKVGESITDGLELVLLDPLGDVLKLARHDKGYLVDDRAIASVIHQSMLHRTTNSLC